MKLPTMTAAEEEQSQNVKGKLESNAGVGGDTLCAALLAGGLEMPQVTH